ncbi:MAG: PIN domain-containing protein [Synergistaceae bacterium]|nr:PIN domain-containing protein [Synergistaceae bacterium]MBR0075300.1 PIN domain-containing protein [Synergistaceae bacterium]
MFNYYFDEDREGHEDVIKLFEAIEKGEFEIYTSELVMRELKKAQEPKKSKMLNLVEEYKPNINILEISDKVKYLGQLYIEKGVIPASHLFDSLHVAVASVYELDCIISYNFHHINRNKTRIMTASVNKEEGYDGIMIITAKEVLNHD